MKWIIFSFFTFVFWVALYLYIYLGFSKPVSLEVGSSPTLTLVYKKHVGAYHKSAPIIESVEQQLGEAGILCQMSFGEYLDDPHKVAEDRLSSHLGCAFAEDGEILDRVASQLGLEKRTLEQRSVIKAQFRGSPSVGPFKVYPKIEDLAREKRLAYDGPPIELYEMQGNEILTTYLQPVQSH